MSLYSLEVKFYILKHHPINLSMTGEDEVSPVAEMNWKPPSFIM